MGTGTAEGVVQDDDTVGDDESGDRHDKDHVPERGKGDKRGRRERKEKNM